MGDWGPNDLKVWLKPRTPPWGNQPGRCMPAQHRLTGICARCPEQFQGGGSESQCSVVRDLGALQPGSGWRAIGREPYRGTEETLGIRAWVSSAIQRSGPLSRHQSCLVSYKTLMPGPFTQRCWFRRGPWICISNKFLADAELLVQWTALGIMLR